MPEYLPLCASRLDLLPSPCRDCAWWQTAGIARVSPSTAATIRERWTTSVEVDWGEPGLIQVAGPDGTRHASETVPAAIHCAPAALVPRLRDLLFAQIPTEAVVLFCLRVEGAPNPRQARRLLQEMLRQLKSRRIREVYAVAVLEGGTPQEEHCEFFSHAFMAANGFEEVRSDHDLSLMRADLRGLLALLAPLETALRRLLHEEPTPSPAAWTSRGPS
jgi:hypothetical protein